MTYLNSDELRTRFGSAEIDELLVDLDAAGITDKLAAVIADAEGLANSYLSKRGPVPVASSSLLKRVVGDIARFYLWDDAASEQVEAAYKQAVALLKDIASGKADLAGASDETDANQAASASSDNTVLVGQARQPLDVSGY